VACREIRAAGVLAFAACGAAYRDAAVRISYEGGAMYTMHRTGSLSPMRRRNSIVRLAAALLSGHWLAPERAMRLGMRFQFAIATLGSVLMILLSPAASLRLVAARVGKLLVLVLAVCLPGMISTVAAGPFVATNVSGELLVTIDDYLLGLPPDVFSAELRAELLASGNEISTDSTRGSSEYVADYQFSAPGIAVRSSLMVRSSAEEATRLVTHFLRGYTESAQRKGNTLRPIDGLDAWYPGSGYFVLSRADTPQHGNFFIVIHDKSVYVATLQGAGAYVDAENVRQFLGPKLERAMTLDPDIPAQLRAPAEESTAASTEKQDNDSSTTPVSLFFFTLVYWVGRWLAHAVNWLCKRPLVSPTLSGLLAMAVVAIGLSRVMLGAIALHVEEITKTDPYEAGRLEGQVLGLVLAPVLMITVVIGVRRLMALKPTRQATTTDATSAPP
jgi:hypothetical protein